MAPQHPQQIRPVETPHGELSHTLPHSASPNPAQKSDPFFESTHSNIHNKSDLWNPYTLIHTENCHTLPHRTATHCCHTVLSWSARSRAFGEWCRNIHNKSDLWKHHTERTVTYPPTQCFLRSVFGVQHSNIHNKSDLWNPYTLIHPQLTN